VLLVLRLWCPALDETVYIYLNMYKLIGICFIVT